MAEIPAKALTTEYWDGHNIGGVCESTDHLVPPYPSVSQKYSGFIGFFRFIGKDSHLRNQAKQVLTEYMEISDHTTPHKSFYDGTFDAREFSPGTVVKLDRESIWKQKEITYHPAVSLGVVLNFEGYYPETPRVIYYFPQYFLNFGYYNMGMFGEGTMKVNWVSHRSSGYPYLTRINRVDVMQLGRGLQERVKNESLSGKLIPGLNPQ